MVIKTNIENEKFLRRMFYLAWKACGGPLGMGIFQNNPTATEDDVWKNIAGSHDYPINMNQPNQFYADYVFGRMMKLDAKIKNDGNIEILPDTYKWDYQGFSGIYPNNASLLNKTASELGCKYEVI